MTVLVTARLRLEPFEDRHIPGLHAIDADPEVMRYVLGRPETMEETCAFVEKVKRRWRETGYSWWSLVDRASDEIVGAGCVQHLRRVLAAEPDPACPLETGWRLRRDRWGQGLASEAAQAMATFAFDTVKPPELFAVCEPANLASSNVMKRLGMADRGVQSWYGKSLATYSIMADDWRARVAASAAS